MRPSPLGALARNVDWLSTLLEHRGRWETAAIAAGASLLVNNLPAAVMLSAHLPAHPRALLLGLDLGPNLAVTGALSAVLWLQVARAEGARPSIARFTLLGLVLVPVSLALTLLVSAPDGDDCRGGRRRQDLDRGDARVAEQKLTHRIAVDRRAPASGRP